ncbi:hypothetical protein HBN50_11755 [Halobacteriovorax sp. GB3]|uniref:DUF6901 family protein n=1 Tax=Halobacteriovorax sp. GB3 TaxID=2719615 RepID=UPI002363141B|nr:hypothetical protein [Halobacteriovorax sp. GB3]MDD0853776.1 hypothetical protein [Halobacteriovorax sp. GB3]
MTDPIINYDYFLKFKNGETFEKKVSLNKHSGELISKTSAPIEHEEIAKLENHQCENCPYSSEDFKNCPVFENILPVLTLFKSHESTEEVEAMVRDRNRTYHKRTPLSVALASLVGLIMATSECEHFDFLKPMAKTHLPFSDAEETLIRSVGFYLMDRYLCGSSEVASLKDLKKSYDQLSVVNQGILERIKDLKGEMKPDSSESLHILESFIQMFEVEYEINLEDLKTYFHKSDNFFDFEIDD